jgi:hypothetical protein
MSTESMSHDRPDILNTVNLVTQCLCIPIVTLFVGLRFGIRGWYRQWAGAEDCILTFYSCRLQEYSVLTGAYRDMFRRVGKYTISRYRAQLTRLDPVHGLLRHCHRWYVPPYLLLPTAIIIKPILTSHSGQVRWRLPLHRRLLD